MFIEGKFSGFVVRWLVDYCWKLLREVQGSNLVGWQLLISIKFGKLENNLIYAEPENVLRHQEKIW
jgi:hypothetical protein